MGRTALPDNVKELKGTLRPSRVNDAQPKPPVVEVGTQPPSWVKGSRRRRAWTSLVELLGDQRLLTSLDTAALGLLVDAFGDYLEASDLVAGRMCGLCGLPMTSKVECTSPAEWETDPVTEERVLVREGHLPGRRYYTTRTKEGSLMIRPHPAVTDRKDAWERVLKMLTHFGMTPATRGKVTAGEGADEDPFARWLSA